MAAFFEKIITNEKNCFVCTVSKGSTLLFHRILTSNLILDILLELEQNNRPLIYQFLTSERAYSKMAPVRRTFIPHQIILEKSVFPDLKSDP